MPVEIPQASALASLPILEPLGEATGKIIRPVEFFRSDYLLVDLDKSGSRFLVRSVTARPFEDGVEPRHNEEIVKCDGVTLVVDWDRPASDYARTKWAERIPERKELDPKGQGQWLVAGTDFTALVMHATIPHDRLVFRSADAKVLFLFLIRRFLMQSKSSRLTADYKINNVVPPMPEDFIEHPTRPLMPHQRIGLLASLHRECYALFMEQGTGKTAVCINRVNLEAARKRAGLLPNRPGVKSMYRVLVICPRQVRMNWQNEFEAFSTVPGKTTVLRGGEIGRAKCLVDAAREEADCAWSVAIMTHDLVDSMKAYLMRIDWDLIIVDESHYCKWHRTKRTLAIRELRSFPYVHQCMVLTGSPIANTVMDLWSQFEIMAEGMSGFKTFENFRKFYGIFKKLDRMDKGGVEKLIGMKNLPLLQERLARVAFMLTKKEARLNLPDKMYDICEVEMTPEQRRIYIQIAEQLLVEIDADHSLTVEHVLTKMLRLAQVTSGHIKWDGEVDPFEMTSTEGKVEQISDPNPKVEALLEMLTSEERDPNGKTIVWATFREDIRVICERLEREGIAYRSYFGGTKSADREEAVWAFNNDPSVRVFVANPQTAGAGLNLVGYDWQNDNPSLPTYTDHEVFFSQNWSATDRAQAEDRAHRKGTRQPVRITDLVVPGTIDEEIRARVLRKRENALTIQDVREIMQRVLEIEDFD